MKKLDDDTVSALRSIEWDGNSAKLTCGQLDRPTYLKVNKVLESLGGKWNRKAQSHLFSDDASAELEAIIESGGYVDRKQALGFFETPAALADELVQIARMDERSVTLEPSAGTGNLIRAIDRATGGTVLQEVVAVEINEAFRKKLVDLACETYTSDFLAIEPGTIGGPFNRVLMNPPFAPRQADIDHVLHAWKFLEPGGRLVAITSIGWTFRTNKKSVEFQRFVERYGERFDNDKDAFRESGTGVSTCIVALDKPEAE